MKIRRRGSGLRGQTDQVQEGPTVLSIIEGMEKDRGAVMAQLRDMALSLPDVEERTMYDGWCREWTPAYYVGSRQLFHVHNFSSGLRATVFVGVNTLEPWLLDSEEVAYELRLLVAKTHGHRTKMVKVPLASVEDLAPFLDLVRVKWRFVTGGP